MNSRSRLAAFRNFGLSLGLPRFHPFPPGLLPPHLTMSRPPGLPLSFPSSYQLLPHHPRHPHLLTHSFPSLPQELLVPRMGLPHPPHPGRQGQDGEEERSSLNSSPRRQQASSPMAGLPYFGQESLLLLRARVMSTPVMPTPGRSDSSPPLVSSRLFIKSEPEPTD